MTGRLTTVPLLLALALPAGAGAAERGRVARVADGDTIAVRVAARTVTVDLLGVRAPRGTECFAAEARAALRRLLRRGTRVRIERDRRHRGRGRYVFKGRALVNATVLRAGAGRASGTARLRRRGALEFASQQARNAGRGIFSAACSGGGTGGSGTGGGAGPGAPAPGTSGAVGEAAAVRTALQGVVLTDFTSTPRSSTRNQTLFCAGGRFDREERISNEGFPEVVSPMAGSWTLLAVARQPDGTLLAEVTMTVDDPSFDPRAIVVSVAPDGTVRRTDANASESAPAAGGGQCSPRTAFAGFENDTPAAREQVRQALLAKRLDEGGTAATDYCSAQRAVRREGGTVTVDGAWTIEWAISEQSSGLLAATIALTDAAGPASARLLVGFSDSAWQVRDISRAGLEGRAASMTAAAC